MKPNWDQYFLGLAFIVSFRSPDPSTKHGCVIIDENKIIIGTGYNGWCRDFNDKEIPTTRPAKYDYVIHSELNCLLNCSKPPRGGTAYVTGKTCNECLKALIQAGIKRVVMADRTSHMLNDETNRIFDFMKNQSKIKIELVDYDFNWILNGINELYDKKS